MRPTTALLASLLFAATAPAAGRQPAPRVYRVEGLRTIAPVPNAPPAAGRLLAGELISEGFESSSFPSSTLVPGTSWAVGSLEGFRRDVNWGTARRRGDIIPASGEYHAYPVGSGSAAVQPGDPVPPNVGAVLTVGPFDFSQVLSGTLSYDVLERTDDIDPMRVCWSPTPGQVLGTDCFQVYTQTRQAYRHETLDLRELAGRKTVYFWWIFTSGTAPTKAGVFFDNVVLSTGTSGGGSGVCGGIAGLTCATGFFCDYSSSSLCGTSDAAGTCQPRGSCPQILEPYCACSGHTYANLCELAQAGELRNFAGTCIQCPDPPPLLHTASYGLPGGTRVSLPCGGDAVPTSATIQIAWGSVPSADGYEWEVRKKADCRDTIGDGDLVASGVTGAAVTTAALPYLPEGTYGWNVRSRRGAQACGFSPSCCFRLVNRDVPGACTPGGTTLCIDDATGDRRFKVSATWSTTQGGPPQGGDAQAIPLSSLGVTRGGLFWFSSPDNPELFVKVLDACAIDGNHWVFASAGTDLGFDLTITDTQKSRSRTYKNADRTLAPPIRDYGSFPCN